MAKIVFNACYGGFSLSREAVLLARELTGNPKWGGATIKGDLYENGEVCEYDFGYIDSCGGGDAIPRHDPILVQVVELLGYEKASGNCAKLCIEEVPDGTGYRIEEYDGNETVRTNYDTDWVVATS